MTQNKGSTVWEEEEGWEWWRRQRWLFWPRWELRPCWWSEKGKGRMGKDLKGGGGGGRPCYARRRGGGGGGGRPLPQPGRRSERVVVGEAGRGANTYLYLYLERFKFF